MSRSEDAQADRARDRRAKRGLKGPPWCYLLVDEAGARALIAGRIPPYLIRQARQALAPLGERAAEIRAERRR